MFHIWTTTEALCLFGSSIISDIITLFLVIEIMWNR